MGLYDWKPAPPSWARERGPDGGEVIRTRREWARANADLIARAFEPNASESDRREAWAAIRMLEGDVRALDGGKTEPKGRWQDVAELAVTRLVDLSELALPLLAQRLGVPMSVLESLRDRTKGEGNG